MKSRTEWASVDSRLQILENALDFLGECFKGRELYDVLSGSVGMTDKEIKDAGFECVPDEEQRRDSDEDS